MALLQIVLALLVQNMGRLLNTAFGWATAMLFGRVPQQRQYYLSAIGLAAFIWLIVAIGIAMPAVGAFLLAFVSLPQWVNPNWVRLGMLIGAIVLPVIVGLLSLLLVEPEQRPKSWLDTARAVLKGYPYTLGLALTLLMMIMVAPAMKLRDFIKGWSSRHIPVVVASSDYFEVVDVIQEALTKGGLQTRRQKASIALRWPTRVFTFLAGSHGDAIVAKELLTLRAAGLEILLHPSDLVIRGREKLVVQALGLINEHLAFTNAYLTWSKEAHEVEDTLTALWHEIETTQDDSQYRRAEQDLYRLRAGLQTLNISTQEWEVLFREILLIECNLLRRLAHVQPQEATSQHP